MNDRRSRMRSRPRWWLAAGQAVVLLPVVRSMLWLRGYTSTMRLLQAGSRVEPSSTATASVPEAVAEVASAVTTVASVIPLRTRCLARSITIWWMSGRRGHSVEVVLGVTRPDGGRLPAHAWVEYRGIPVNDTADVRTRFIVMPWPPLGGRGR